MHTIVEVDPKGVEKMEPLGTKRKYWFREDGYQILFKTDERGTGEDWAEKLVCEFAGELGLPHVEYNLAVEVKTGSPGVICKTCVPPLWSLVLGNELLGQSDSAYPSTTTRKYGVREHTCFAVKNSLADIKLPFREWCTTLPAEISSALDVFVGYVLLDAWTANQDRHHQNWGVLECGGTKHLAPTFDHGAALARNLTEGDMLDRLKSRDSNRQIAAFVRRAKSGFYRDATDSKPLSTYDAWTTFAEFEPTAAATWLAKLAEITDDHIGEMIVEIPASRMSETAKDFVFQLLVENRKRILRGAGC